MSSEHTLIQHVQKAYRCAHVASCHRVQIFKEHISLWKKTSEIAHCVKAR